MKTIYHCIRCERETYLGNLLTQRQSEAIMQIVVINLVEVHYENIVCMNCRLGIGDEVSDQMLKYFNQ